MLCTVLEAWIVELVVEPEEFLYVGISDRG